MRRISDTALATQSLMIADLRTAYEQGSLSPTLLVETLIKRMNTDRDNPVWIKRVADNELRQAARVLEARNDRHKLPLYGVPFAVKDNIDVAGMPTTAACPALEYLPVSSSPLVSLLLDAGAMLIGKTNMDQLATGLVGTRSPYGECRNAFNPDYISGGSSSGSALAVALGHVSFALGTDTAGSGRVPAALNHLIGYKPSRGLLSTRGLVPACRHLDCVSLFVRRVADLDSLLPLCIAFDAEDPYARRMPPPRYAARPLSASRFGILAEAQREFFGDEDAAACYDRALSRLSALGASLQVFDFTPFEEAAQLLYEGAFLAERSAALEHYPAVGDRDLLPVIQRLLEKGRGFSARQLFADQQRLQALRARIAPLWKTLDSLFLPTIGPAYLRSEVRESPLTLNRNLGHYTNFVNLLDMSAMAVPAGVRRSGIPFGVQFVAPAFSDCQLLDWAREWEAAVMPAETSDG
jgi:allophanate hydrolase